MVKITIPAVGPSINCGYAGKHRRYATKELKDFKTYVRMFVRNKIKSAPWMVDVPLELEINIGKKWLTKSGLPRRADLSNLWKFSEDAFLDALGVDDKWVFKTKSEKIQSDIPFTEFILRPLA